MRFTKRWRVSSESILFLEFMYMTKSRNRIRRGTRKIGGTTPTYSEGTNSDDYLNHWSKIYGFKNGELHAIVKRNYDLYMKAIMNNPNIDMTVLRTDFVYSVYVDTITTVDILKNTNPDYKLKGREVHINTSFIQNLLARLHIVTSGYEDFINILNQKPSVEKTRDFRDLAKEMNLRQYTPALIVNKDIHKPNSITPAIPMEKSHPTKPNSVTPTKTKKQSVTPPKTKSSKIVSAMKRTQMAGDCFAYATARSITRTFTLLGLTTEETVNMIYDAIYCIILKYGIGICKKGGDATFSLITVLDFLTKDAETGFVHLFELNYNMIPPICEFEGVCKHGHILNFSPQHKSIFVGRLHRIIQRNILEIKTVYEVFSKKSKNLPPKTIYEVLLSRYQPVICTYLHAMVLRKWNMNGVECIDSNQSYYIIPYVMQAKDIRTICKHKYTCLTNQNQYILNFHWMHINEWDDDMVHIRDSIYPPTDVESPSYDRMKPIIYKVFPIPDELTPHIDVNSKYINIRLRYTKGIICGFFYMENDIINTVGYLKIQKDLYFGIFQFMIEKSKNTEEPDIRYIQRIDDIGFNGYNEETSKVRSNIDPTNFDAIIKYLSKQDDAKEFVFMKHVASLYP